MDKKTEFIKHKLEKWEKLLVDPLWYEKVMPELVEIWKQEYTEEEKEVLWEMVYSFFEDRLYTGKIAIAKEGPDFDQWREPIDAIVIHYTGNKKTGADWKRLSTIGFLRQYAQDYWRYEDVYGIPTRGEMIWSNHLRAENGEYIPVFYAYHWLVKKDGSFERLLNDNEIGWQAGNKDINFSSIAIVLEGEYVDSVPPNAMIEAVTSIITTYYSRVDKNRIFGHREVNPKTICPGNRFLSEWKGLILDKPD